MTAHIQQVETAELNMAPQSADFAGLETVAPSIEGICIANDNATRPARRNILVKRRARRARLAAR